MGETIGKIIFQVLSIEEAPSIVADSRISSGTFWMVAI